MDKIRIFVEQLVALCGVHGAAVPVLRHVLLVLVAVFLAWLSYFLCERILIPVVGRITKRTSAKWDDVLFNRRVLKAACQIIPAVVIWQLLPLVFYQFPVVRELLTRVTAIYITLSTLHLTLVFLNSLRELDIRRSSMQQYLLSFIGVLKIIFIFLALIVVISILINRSPMRLFAGLGATSAILMLVFKDTIEGLVAGVRLTSNDMLHRGDWITVPAANADGTVEEMTLTTVKIRNFDNTIITVSPISLVNGSFQNWTGMQESPGRRVSRKILLDLHSIHFNEDGVTNLTIFRQAVEDYLQAHGAINHDMTMMARLLEASQYGQPLQLYFFLKNKEWVHYEHELAAIMEHVMAMAPEFGLRIYELCPTVGPDGKC
ncbi:MAG: mechanosensitive ion channel family protein [Prevotella sp.]|nr:mechanosensitive ion channel family protein [Prevotella sp.]